MRNLFIALALALLVGLGCDEPSGGGSDPVAAASLPALAPAAPSNPGLEIVECLAWPVDKDSGTVRVRASWSDNADDEIGYELYITLEGGAGVDYVYLDPDVEETYQEITLCNIFSPKHAYFYVTALGAESDSDQLTLGSVYFAFDVFDFCEEFPP